MGDGEIDVSFLQLFRETFVAPFHQVKSDFGMFLPKSGDERRQQITFTDEADPDGEIAGFFIRDVFQRAGEGFFSAGELQGIGIEDFARISKLERHMAYEKFHAPFFFKGGHVRREGLLRQMQLFRRACEVLLPRQHDEVIQRLKVHSAPFYHKYLL